MVEPRVPNSKEIKKEVYMILSFLKSEKLIDSKRYKTIKGHARRSQFEFVFNFFRKNYPDEFMYLAKFMCTKTIRDTAELIKEEP